MIIKPLEMDHISACADILCAVYNNELWMCRWDKETAMDYLQELPYPPINMPRHLNSMKKTDLCNVNMSFSWQKIWWSDAKIEKSLGVIRKYAISISG